MHYFYIKKIGNISVGKISAPIRNLTNPQIVIITFSYFLELHNRGQFIVNCLRVPVFLIFPLAVVAF